MLGSSVEPPRLRDGEHARRLGRIENLELRVARPAPERLSEDEGREARSAHPEHDDPVRAGRRLRDESRELRKGRLHPLDRREPAERAGDRLPVLLFRPPERGVARPDAGDRPIAGERFERLAVGALAAGEFESQATLTAFSFSSSAFNRAS